jgi:hypothetical protein
MQRPTFFTFPPIRPSMMKNLPALVREKFKAAQAAGDLNFYATQVAIVQVNSFPV